jgi:hypothetical protein
MKLLKNCSVEFRPEGIYIFSFRNTPYGMVANLPPTKLPTDTSPGQLGETVLNQLERIELKQFDVDLRASVNEYKQYLADLGFRSVKAFAKGSACVSVLIEGDRIKVEPREMTASGAFLHLPQQKKYCGFDKHELGRLVEEQRSCCK